MKCGITSGMVRWRDGTLDEVRNNIRNGTLDDGESNIGDGTVERWYFG